MILETKGIIFRTVKYSESSIIADIYTEEKGLLTYIISGVRKKNAKVKAGLLQLMSLVDLVGYYQEGKSMHRIKEIKSAYPYRAIPFEVLKSAIGLFMIELAQKSIKEQEENQPLFQFLFENFVYLDSCTASPANVHLHFMIHLCAYLGFQPQLPEGDSTPYFDMQNGVFVSSVDHQYILSLEESTILKKILNIPLETAHTIEMNRKERNALLLQFHRYYRLHIENFPDLNTPAVLAEILA